MAVSRKDLTLLLPAVALLAVGAVLQAVGAHFPGDAYQQHAHVMAGLGTSIRCLALLVFAVYAVGTRSLTPWIFVAMVAGAELGFDAPKFAVQYSGVLGYLLAADQDDRCPADFRDACGQASQGMAMT